MRRFWPLMIRRVVGYSMSPTLEPGTLVVGYCWRRMHATDTVVIASMDGREVIKRVHAIMPEGITLLGDNPSFSTDSRQKGLVQARSIKSVVVWPRTL